MSLKRNNQLEQVLAALNQKELVLIKKRFGLTETELTYLLTLSSRYRKNPCVILKKLLSY